MSKEVSKSDKKIEKDSLLFHCAHGLCRVGAIVKSPETKEWNYTLIPVTKDQGKVRFVMPESALEQSGFKKLISETDGCAILKFLETGRKKSLGQSQTLEFATLIRAEAASDAGSVKDSRKRQQVATALKGLVGELSFVLKMSWVETMEEIKKILGRNSNISAMVLNAFSNLEK